MSLTFLEIKLLVENGILNNDNGFRAGEVIANSNLNPGTVRTFLPKHTINDTKYFERIAEGLYRIKTEFL